jgi:RNA polymerase sigma factor (sigma-70 family)
MVESHLPTSRFRHEDRHQHMTSVTSHGHATPEPSIDDRRVLINLAYRMLGSYSEAADAVQEGLTRWYGLPAERRGEVRSVRAWLLTTVSRICLDTLDSARVRRETYVGEWLPEPVPDAAAATTHRQDPADQITLDESVSMALLVVLETLTAAERVVFVLHDVFRYRFDEISAIVGRSPEACRQLAASARRRLATSGVRPTASTHERTVAALLHAWRSRDVDSLIGLLDASVHVTTDGGGHVTAARAPIIGRERVARVLVAVLHRHPQMTLELARVNGDPGLVARDADGRVIAVIAVAVGDDRIRRMWVMRNPYKLAEWN